MVASRLLVRADFIRRPPGFRNYALLNVRDVLLDDGQTIAILPEVDPVVRKGLFERVSGEPPEIAGRRRNNTTRGQRDGIPRVVASALGGAISSLPPRTARVVVRILVSGPLFIRVRQQVARRFPGAPVLRVDKNGSPSGLVEARDGVRWQQGEA